MSRPTPDTDARTYVPSLGGATVPAEFARQLERERDEAREALKALAPLTYHDCYFYKDMTGNCMVCSMEEAK